MWHAQGVTLAGASVAVQLLRAAVNCGNDLNFDVVSGGTAMDERGAYIALNMMEKVGPVTVRALVLTLGSAAAIFTETGAALMKAPGVGVDTANSILRQREGLDWQGESARAETLDARIVTYVDPEYPESLREIHDPPLALYVKGGFQSRDRHAIGMVGARRCTRYGQQCAESLSYSLAKAGVTVVSGLAKGIDTAAHEGALKGQGRTLAVLGSALDCLYPPSNRDLAERIANQGAVISEFAFGRQPDKSTFPMRNRVVSGLSKGIVVVEAGRKSGALITADQALEQGRTVLAMPGRIDSPASAGTHALIQQGAKLVTSAEDVLQEFEFLTGWSGIGQERQAARPAPSLSDKEARIMAELEQGEQNVDAVIRATGLGPGEVSALLIGLEMKRLIRMLPGRRIEAVG